LIKNPIEEELFNDNDFNNMKEHIENSTDNQTPYEDDNVLKDSLERGSTLTNNTPFQNKSIKSNNSDANNIIINNSNNGNGKKKQLIYDT
jgi:hypothetical protein